MAVTFLIASVGFREGGSIGSLCRLGTLVALLVVFVDELPKVEKYFHPEIRLAVRVLMIVEAGFLLDG